MAMHAQQSVPLENELEDLPQELRWREWMNRVEAVIFTSNTIVPRATLQKLIGESVSLDLLITDIQMELKGRSFELIASGGGWMFRTRPHYASIIKSAADTGEQERSFNEIELAVLAAIAYHQPITRLALNEIFAREISRDTLSRLQYKSLITNGPKSPKRGAPHTFVTTPEFLVMFNLESLRDLPEVDRSTIEADYYIRV